MIADTLQSVVREVDLGATPPTERILAGTGVPGYGRTQEEEGVPADRAHLNHPRGVAVGPNGTIYIADTDNNRVRAVDPTGGTITTFAGTGETLPDGGVPLDEGKATNVRFTHPTGVAAGADGSVLIATQQAARKVSADGTVATVAKVKAVQAVFGARDDVFVLTNDGTVSRFHGSAVEVVAGTSPGRCVPSAEGGPAVAAFLCAPAGLAVDGAGNLFISDTGNNRVRRVDGTVAATTGYPDAPTVTYAGTRAAGDGPDGPASASSLRGPQGLAVDAAGTLFLADTGNHVVREVTVGPASLTRRVAGDGRCCFSDTNEGVTALRAQLDLPAAVATDPAGTVYVADTGNHRVVKISATGIVTTLAGTGTAGFSGDGDSARAAQLNAPMGLATHIDPQGSVEVFIADTANNRVRKVTPDGIITTVAGDGVGALPPVDLSDGSTRDQLLRPAGGVPPVTVSPTRDDVPATDAPLARPAAVAVGADAALYIAEADGNRIRRVAPGGVITTVAGTGQGGYADAGDATQAKLYSPRGIALDDAGNVYIADYGNNVVRKLVSGGLITTFAGVPGNARTYSVEDGPAANAQLLGPRGVTVTPGADPAVYVTLTTAMALPAVGDVDTGAHGPDDNRLRVVRGGVITTVAGEVEAGFRGDGGPARPAPPAPAARFRAPLGVAVGPGGLFVADSGNNRIRRIELDATGGGGGPPSPSPSPCTVLAPPEQPLGPTAPGSWAPAGCLSEARRAHTATRLDDGRVLVAGGYGASGFPIRSAELYDPANNTWSAAASMSVARGGQTATLLEDGRVLVAGGRGGGGVELASAELYDPATGRWQPTGAMGQARSGHQATRLEGPACLHAVVAKCGTVLITGGATSVAELYDTGTGTFVPVTPMANPHMLGTATLLNPASCQQVDVYPCGKVLVAGGVAANVYPSAGTVEAEIFDPTTATWEPTGPLGTGRWNHAASPLVDGRVLVAGGLTSANDGPTTSAEIYDPRTGTWSPTGSLNAGVRTGCNSAGPSDRLCSTFTATLLSNGGRVLVAGGGPGTGSGPPELFDAGAGPGGRGGFIFTGPAIEGRFSHTATELANGDVLLVGGVSHPTTDGAALASAEVFDPAGVQRPVVTGIAPHSGPATGGTEVVLTGVGLGEVSEVTFGGVPAPSFRTDGPTRVMATTPRHGVDVVDVTVKAPGGAATVPGGFRYGTWSATSAGRYARGRHTASVLPDGSVLLVGGASSATLADPVASSEQYRPATRAWTDMGFTPDHRVRHASVVIAGGLCAPRCGQLLAVGGTDDKGAPLASAAIFDPAAMSWNLTGTTMTTARVDPTATVLQDGRVLVAGGDPAGTAELYDPASDTWKPTGTRMASVRSGHSATLLASGLVLVAGGDHDATSELYDPATDTWTGATPMRARRARHTATPMGDGTVLVTGGTGFSGATASVERYDPATGTWADQASLPAPRSGHTATLLADGDVLVVGGAGAPGTASATDTAWLFDPGGGPSGSWSATSALIEGRRDHQATALADGSVLVTGGFDSNGVALGSAEVYAAPDIARAPTIGSVDPPAVPTFGVRRITIVGTGLSPVTRVRFGTVDAVSVSYVSDTEVVASSPPQAQGAVSLEVSTPGGSSKITFTYGAGAWSGTGRLHQGRYHHTATLLDRPDCHQKAPPPDYPCGKVLVVGGVAGGYRYSIPSGGPANAPALASAELFDPASGGWAVAAPMPEGRSGHTATLLADGKVLVVGGTNAADDDNVTSTPDDVRHGGPLPRPTAMDTALVFDPTTNLWTPTAPLHHGRMGHTATRLGDGRVLVAGGTSDEADIGLVKGSRYAELFDPGTRLWSQAADMHVARVLHTATRLGNGDVLVTGGRDEQPGVVTATEIFHAGSGEWERVGDAAIGRFLHQAIGLPAGCEGDPGSCRGVLAVGGITNVTAHAVSSATLLPAAEVSDGRDWRPTSTIMARQRAGHTLVALPGGQVLAAGGGTQSLYAVASDDSAEVYDPGPRRFAFTSSMQEARGLATATVLDGPACRAEGQPPTYCGSVLVAGGIGRGDVLLGRLGLATAEIYTPAPTVAAIAPAAGSVTGGARVVVTGAGFAGTTAVSFGDVRVPCPSPACQVDSTSELTVVVPAHSPGPVQVAVDSAGGTSAHIIPVTAAAFTYVGQAGQVTDLVATAVSGHDVELSFTAPDDGTTTSPATGYVVRLADAAVDDDAHFEAARSMCGGVCHVEPGVVVHLTVRDLEPATTYYFAVRALSAMDVPGPLSNPASATTLGDVPPCPTDITPDAGEIVYPGGRYSLVGAPGGTVLGATSPLYGWFDMGAGGSYSVAASSAPAEAGRGYWAWFSCPAVVSPTRGGAGAVSFSLGAYHASMVGNPLASGPATVSGHDYAARWDPSMNGGAGGYRLSAYRQPQSLAIGEGAWVFSFAQSEVRVGP